MVVGVLAPVLGLALALPTGLLFGLGYGTGVRVGYEQLYPLLFPAKDVPRTAQQVKETIIGMNTVYNAIGGKEASQMGMGMGIQAAGDLLKDPDFPVLEELESRLSGRTPSKLNPHDKSLTDNNFLTDSNLNQLYSFEWVQDFIQRISVASRSQLIIWRNFLESDPTNKLSSDDISTLKSLITQALLSDSQTEGGDTVTAAYRATFQKLVDDLPVRDLRAMYNVRGQYPSWQQQIIIVAFRLIDEDTHQTDYQRRRAEYEETYQEYQANIKKSKTAYLFNLNKRVHVSAEQKLINQKQVKNLINFITLSRNDLTLKSLANNHWNKRIWKKHAV